MDSIYLLSPTHDQNGWDRIRKNIVCINDINEIGDCKNSIIVCEDMQVQLKGNKILTEMILNERHRNLLITQCKQYTQATDLVQKMNADYFVLLGPFTLGDCQYFTEKFLSSINARVFYEIFKYIKKSKQVMLMNMSGSNKFLVKDCLVL